MSDETETEDNSVIRQMRGQIEALKRDLGQERQGKKELLTQVQTFQQEKRDSLMKDLPDSLKELMKDKPIEELPGLIESLRPVIGKSEEKPAEHSPPPEFVTPTPTGTPPGAQKHSRQELKEAMATNPQQALQWMRAGLVDLTPPS